MFQLVFRGRSPIEANKGKTYQDVTAMADPMAGLFGSEGESSGEGENSSPFETQDYDPHPNRDRHGQFACKSGSGIKNDLISSEPDATIKPLKVRTPDGREVGLAEGTSITKQKAIAGQGHRTPIRDKGLPHRHPGATGFTKMRGEAVIDDHGTLQRVEVHWYESQKTGVVEMKVKRPLE